MSTNSTSSPASTIRKNRALTIPATIISYILHPVFLPLLTVIALYVLAPSEFAGISASKFKLILLPFIINYILFPLLSVALLKAVGFIDSIQLRTSRERIIPLIMIMIFYFWMNHVTKNQHYPFIIHVLTLGNFIGIIVVFLLNIFMKISLHASGGGMLIGIMLVLMFTSPVNMAFPFFLGLFVAGIIGTARMILGAHNSQEIYLGYAAGIVSQLIAWWYL